MYYTFKGVRRGSHDQRHGRDANVRRATEAVHGCTVCFRDVKQTHLANVADKARKAYSAQASAHVVAWWGDGPPPRMPEPLTRAAFTELVRSREASKAALAAYRDALDER